MCFLFGEREQIVHTSAEVLKTLDKFFALINFINEIFFHIRMSFFTRVTNIKHSIGF